MKSKDTLLLEEAYSQVRVNEGITNEAMKFVFKKLASILKEKYPEVFNSLAACKTPEELIKKVFPKGVPNKETALPESLNTEGTTLNEGVVEKVNDILKYLNSPLSGLTVGAVLAVVGKILMMLAVGPLAALTASAVAPSTGVIVTAAGYLLMALGAVVADTAPPDNQKINK